MLIFGSLIKTIIVFDCFLNFINFYISMSVLFFIIVDMLVALRWFTDNSFTEKFCFYISKFGYNFLE